ncbi:hypothetical protein CEXT_273121 [Caerostris extrusa]|uniref:Uncharacterized protein n=1 Tax=Caerostris extrusa TaxID=172846 RepID=A0AAV4Q2B2_CAEEX|nr:hypothetical protein CEXT_273121 [Caerostris extrusa]
MVCRWLGQCYSETPYRLWLAESVSLKCHILHSQTARFIFFYQRHHSRSCELSLLLFTKELRFCIFGRLVDENAYSGKSHCSSIFCQAPRTDTSKMVIFYWHAGVHITLLLSLSYI